MKVGIVAGFDGDMAPDLPMLTEKRWVGVRRDIDMAHLEKWAAEFRAYPGMYLLSILRSAFDCSPDQMVAEATPMAQAFVRAGLVGRCGIEIGNEPNISVDKDKRPTWAQDPVAFRTVVNACAQAIWAVNPKIDVVSGGVSNTGWKEQAWLARAADGMHPDVVIGYHTYRQEDTPETPRGWFVSRDAEDAALRVIFGSRRRMLTEFGWGEGKWQKKVLLPGVPLTLPPAWLDRLKSVTVKGSWTEQQVAAMAEREIARAEANGAECADWYQIRGRTGILRDDGTLKPVADVAAKFWEEPDEDESPTVSVSFRVVDGMDPIVGAEFTMGQDDEAGTKIHAVSDSRGNVLFNSSTPGWGCSVRIEREGFDPIDERRQIPAVSTIGEASWYTTMRRPAVTLAVFDEQGRAVEGAAVTIRHDSADIAPFSTTTNAAGQMTYSTKIPGWGVTVLVSKDGFQPFEERRALPMVSAPDWAVATLKRIAKEKHYSKAQLNDIQLDLMVWCPEVKPNFDANGWDPELQIKRVGDNGAVCRGVEAGWVWSTTIANYPPAKRQQVYAAAKRDGHTHFGLHVAAIGPGPGYHGIYPITQAMADGYGQAMNTVYRELLDAGLIPVCAGVAPGAPPAPGFDVGQVKVAMTDWDNSAIAACRIRAVHDAFPNAWVWYELPAEEIYPKPCDCGRSCESVVPASDNGGAWLRSMQQRYPRFVGLVCEVNAPDGVGANVDQLEKIYAWWRDVPINLGEIDTYWKFWDNTPKATAIEHNDTLHAQCPWAHGTMSGWTCTPPPPDEDVDTDTNPFTGDMIDPGTVIVEDIPDLLRWPATARITRVELRTGGVHLEFTKRDGQNRWPDIRFGEGNIQFSAGLCLRINGQWYAAAPELSWNTRDECLGPIQSQNFNGSGIGQIPKNLFYNATWWPHLAGYQPKPGELIGLFVTAGNVRERDTPLHERSNIVTFPLPDSDKTATFTWSTE